MLYNPLLISITEVLFTILPILLIVAFVTVAERKTLASMQRRLGPNSIGFYGSLQAFADALKLLLKEYISPTQANLMLFFLGPIITLAFSLLGFAVIPYGPGLAIIDFNLAILYILAVSSLSTYGILLAGWSANSKYAFLGSLRSTAQLISYELVLSSVILLVVLLTGSLSLTVNIEAQRAVWFLLPLLPMFIIFFMGSIAETNRAPFDLAEAESELVSGFMTEHAAVIFVFFFLAEYGSILLICIFVGTLFIGGYLFMLDVTYITNVIYSFTDLCLDCIDFIIILIDDDLNHYISIFLYEYIYNIRIDYSYYEDRQSAFTLFSQNRAISNSFVPTIEYDTRPFYNTFDYIKIGLFSGLILGLKSLYMIFTFIWARASFPRTRFDQLMSYCWTDLLPIVIGFILLLPCFIYCFESICNNFCLLLLPLFNFKTKILNLKNNIFKRNFLKKCLVIFLIGFMGRYLVYKLGGVNVFLFLFFFLFLFLFIVWLHMDVTYVVNIIFYFKYLMLLVFLLLIPLLGIFTILIAMFFYLTILNATETLFGLISWDSAEILLAVPFAGSFRSPLAFSLKLESPPKPHAFASLPLQSFTLTCKLLNPSDRDREDRESNGWEGWKASQYIRKCNDADDSWNKLLEMRRDHKKIASNHTYHSKAAEKAGVNGEKDKWVKHMDEAWKFGCQEKESAKAKEQQLKKFKDEREYFNKLKSDPDKYFPEEKEFWSKRPFLERTLEPGENLPSIAQSSPPGFAPNFVSSFFPILEDLILSSLFAGILLIFNIIFSIIGYTILLFLPILLVIWLLKKLQEKAK